MLPPHAPPHVPPLVASHASHAHPPPRRYDPEGTNCDEYSAQELDDLYENCPTCCFKAGAEYDGEASYEELCLDDSLEQAQGGAYLTGGHCFVGVAGGGDNAGGNIDCESWDGGANVCQYDTCTGDINPAEVSWTVCGKEYRVRYGEQFEFCLTDGACAGAPPAPPPLAPPSSPATCRERVGYEAWQNRRHKEEQERKENQERVYPSDAESRWVLNRPGIERPATDTHDFGQPLQGELPLVCASARRGPRVHTVLKV